MTRVPTIHINFEPDVTSKNKLIEQFWECLNTRLDLGQDGNYVSTSSNTIESLTVKEGDILEEEPHFFLYLPVSRANDDFEYSLKRFTEQVSKIDNHVFLIILIKSGPDISHMEFFDRGFGTMKKIYLKDSCIFDDGDTKTTFNELADILKRKYNFKVKTDQACQEEDVTEGNILEEEPHFFFYPSVSRPNDDFELSLKLFTEQVSKIDSHVSLIGLTKSGSHISRVDLFYRGSSQMKRICLKESFTLEQEYTKIFNELADILKRESKFEVRKKEDVLEDPTQHQQNRHRNPENSGRLSITIRPQGICQRFCNLFCCFKKQEVEVTLDVETFESAKTLMEKDNFKFQRQFEDKFHIKPGHLQSIVKAMIDELEREGVENRMLTCDELENLRRKLNDNYRLQTDAFEELMLQIYNFHEEGLNEDDFCLVRCWLCIRMDSENHPSATMYGSLYT